MHIYIQIKNKLFIKILITILWLFSYSANAEPRFLDYPVKGIYTGKNNIFSGYDDDSRIVDDLKEGAKNKVNFAGKYILVTTGCGGGAICGFILDPKSGKDIAELPDIYLVIGDSSKNDFSIEYYLYSRLIRISGISATDSSKGCQVNYYYFNDEEFIDIPMKDHTCEKE